MSTLNFNCTCSVVFNRLELHFTYVRTILDQVDIHCIAWYASKFFSLPPSPCVGECIPISILCYIRMLDFVHYPAAHSCIRASEHPNIRAFSIRIRRFPAVSPLASPAFHLACPVSHSLGFRIFCCFSWCLIPKLQSSSFCCFISLESYHTCGVIRSIDQFG